MSIVNRPLTVLLAAAVVGSSFTWTPSDPAVAHAKLLRAQPAPGATLQAAPKVVRLWFNEELDPRRSGISVWDAKRRRVDDGKGGVDLDDLERKSLLARLRPIGPGTYTVRWRAVSANDLNVGQGSFRFRVTAP